MLVKGTCAKKDLMMSIYNAILSPGSNWTEISSNKTNDFKKDGNDGWVFKSPPIGHKKQSIFMRLKSHDLSTTESCGNHFYIWLSDSYTPNNEEGKNGVFTKMGQIQLIFFTPNDNKKHTPDTLYNYYIDILDHRILMIIELHTITAITYPNFMYIGYPDLSTNLEGEEYTNQFVASSNLGDYSRSKVYWHKAPGEPGNKGQNNKFAYTSCQLNTSNPTPMGLYLLNPIYFIGDGLENNLPNTGPLGIFDGIYGLPNTNIVNGDIVKIGKDDYKVFNLNQYLINNSNSGYSWSNYGDGHVGYYNSLKNVTCIAIKM
ncbi:hypothetical protein Z962_09525 [Clostridium botulinum C/D str. BKT12695]|nr:hypothetical protein Z962_09525 [Clostridium botulinum C/D str. BKT12695]